MTSKSQSQQVEIELEKAQADDCELFFTWRNLPEIVALGTLQNKVSLEEHQAWFLKKIKSKNSLIFTISQNKRKIGQIRFDKNGTDDCTVSIYLLPGFPGKGSGVDALKKGSLEAFSKLKIQKITAIIRSDNEISQRAFSKAGFIKLTAIDNQHIKFELPKFPLIPHNKIQSDQHLEESVLHTLRSGYWACGPKVSELEAEFCIHSKFKYAIAVASGLSAIRLSLLALNIKKGDKVLVPAYSCVALANAVLACDATPVAVDVEPGSWNMSFKEFSELNKKHKAKACIIVNTFGATTSLDPFLKTGIPIIEDCSHSLIKSSRPKYDKNRIVIQSFYATKLLGAGEGGIILTNTEKIASFCKSYRDYSDQKSNGKRLNDKMTDLEATMALSRLTTLAKSIEKRKALAKKYTELLSKHAMKYNLVLPNMESNKTFYRYSILLNGTNVEKLTKTLKNYGIDAAHPVENWLGDSIKKTAVASNAFKNLISLPLYPALSEEDISRICYCFLKSLK